MGHDVELVGVTSAPLEPAQKKQKTLTSFFGSLKTKTTAVPEVRVTSAPGVAAAPVVAAAPIAAPGTAATKKLVLKEAKIESTCNLFSWARYDGNIGWT